MCHRIWRRGVGHSTGHGDMGRMEKGAGMWVGGDDTGQERHRLCGQDIGDALHSDMGPGQDGDMAVGTRV